MSHYKEKHKIEFLKNFSKEEYTIIDYNELRQSIYDKLTKNTKRVIGNNISGSLTINSEMTRFFRSLKQKTLIYYQGNKGNYHSLAVDYNAYVLVRFGEDGIYIEKNRSCPEPILFYGIKYNPGEVIRYPTNAERFIYDC